MGGRPLRALRTRCLAPWRASRRPAARLRVSIAPHVNPCRLPACLPASEQRSPRCAIVGLRLGGELVHCLLLPPLAALFDPCLAPHPPPLLAFLQSTTLSCCLIAGPRRPCSCDLVLQHPIGTPWSAPLWTRCRQLAGQLATAGVAHVAALRPRQPSQALPCAAPPAGARLALGAAARACKIWLLQGLTSGHFPNRTLCSDRAMLHRLA